VKKILFISLALIMALSVGLVGCAGGGGGVAAPSAIKIGAVRDLDQDLAFYDQIAGGPAYRAFNKTINGGGGIFMSTYNKSLPLEIIIQDYDIMSPTDLQTQTEYLITVKKVHFMFGGPGTTTVYTQAAVCDAYGILLMTLEGGATDMIADPDKLASWSNTFINLNFADWYQIPVLYKMLKDKTLAQNRTSPKAYVMYIDNEHGAEYLNVTKRLFGVANVTAVGHHQYTATQTDIDTIVNNAKTAFGNASDPNYDIFCCYSYMPYLEYFINAAATYSFGPPAIMMGPGAEAGSMLLSFGANMTGICGFASANNKSSVAPETVTMSFADMWALVQPEAHGFPAAYCWSPWAHPVMWAGLEMWAEAVEQVGHLGVGYTSQVRSVMVSFNSTNPCTTVLGDTWYTVFGGGLGGGVIDYQCMPGQICQWQNNYPEIVGYSTVTSDIPKYDVTSSFWYPMTNNWTWLP
jgi:hypothetical protein